MKRGNIRTRIAKLEELVVSQGGLVIIVMKPGESEPETLARTPEAENAGLVVFVENYSKAGQWPPADEPQDIDSAIQAEIEGLKAHGYTEQDIKEAIVKSASRVSIPGRGPKSQRNPARPAVNGNGSNGGNSDNDGTDAPGLFSSDLGKLFR